MAVDLGLGHNSSSVLLHGGAYRLRFLYLSTRPAVSGNMASRLKSNVVNTLKEIPIPNDRVIK